MPTFGSIEPANVLYGTTATQYYVLLKDHSGNQVANFPGGGRGIDLGGLQAFSYRKRLKTPGAISVRIFGNDSRVKDYLLLDDGLDFQWEFWRNDPLDTAREFYKDHEGFHRGEEIMQSESGRLVYLSRGTGFNSLLVSETINFNKGSSQALKSGDVSVVVAEFVDENIGPGAGVDANGDSRIRPGLTIKAIPALGKTWTGDRANKILGDVLQEIARFAPADYMILGNGPAQFVFEWKNTRWGLDRTAANTDGNAPVLFSALTGNVSQLESSYNQLDAVTTVYVLGQGTRELKIKRTVSDAALLALSPWSRRAISRSQKNEPSVSSLDDRGQEMIDDQRARRRMSFSVRQTTSTRYGRDWDMGDLVEVEDYFGNVAPMKITGVTVTVQTSGEEAIIPEFEAE